MSWTFDELRDRLQVPFESPFPSVERRPTISVLSLTPEASGELTIEITVEDERNKRQRWLLVFETWNDIARYTLNTAYMTLRANLEEWWDTGAAEDGPGFTARRLS